MIADTFMNLFLRPRTKAALRRFGAKKLPSFTKKGPGRWHLQADGTKLARARMVLDNCGRGYPL
jgi:hypothetical protein